MMNKHVHAELMLQYANDAMTSDRPWELWQVSSDATNWVSMGHHPIWSGGMYYRRKPQTLTYDRTITLRKDNKKCPVGMNKLPTENNVRFTFNSDSGDLIKVELIKE